MGPQFTISKKILSTLRLGSHNGISAWIARGIRFPFIIFHHGFQIHGTELEEWACQFDADSAYKIDMTATARITPIEMECMIRPLTSDITSLILLHYREVHSSPPICCIALLLTILLATNGTFKEEEEDDNPLHALKNCWKRHHQNEDAASNVTPSVFPYTLKHLATHRAGYCSIAPFTYRCLHSGWPEELLCRNTQ